MLLRLLNFIGLTTKKELNNQWHEALTLNAELLKESESKYKELLDKHNELKELQVHLKEDQITAIHKYEQQKRFTDKWQKIAKLQAKKTNKLLVKQKRLKERIVNLEAEVHNTSIQLDSKTASYLKIAEELQLLRDELKELGVHEPKDITELQAELRKVKHEFELKVRYQLLLETLLDNYMYGFSFAYIESLKPRRIDVLTSSKIKGNYGN